MSAQMESYIRSHADAAAFLGDRESRKLGHNTYVERRQGHLVIRYHRTDIIRYWPSGMVVLDCDGWQTSTTKWRLNECSPFSVHSEGKDEYGDPVWAVCSAIDNARFEDGMYWMPDTGFSDWKDARMERKRERIRIQREADRRARQHLFDHAVRVSRQSMREPEEVTMF